MCGVLLLLPEDNVLALRDRQAPPEALDAIGILHDPVVGRDFGSIPDQLQAILNRPVETEDHCLPLEVEVLVEYQSFRHPVVRVERNIPYLLEQVVDVATLLACHVAISPTGTLGSRTCRQLLAGPGCSKPSAALTWGPHADCVELDLNHVHGIPPSFLVAIKIKKERWPEGHLSELSSLSRGFHFLD